MTSDVVNGGEITSTTHKVGAYSYNDTFRLATIERAGYTFLGFDVCQFHYNKLHLHNQNQHKF